MLKLRGARFDFPEQGALQRILNDPGIRPAGYIVPGCQHSARMRYGDGVGVQILVNICRKVAC